MGDSDTFTVQNKPDVNFNTIPLNSFSPTTVMYGVDNLGSDSGIPYTNIFILLYNLIHV